MTQATHTNIHETSPRERETMMSTTILLAQTEQEALTILLNVMTSDDIREILERSFTEKPENFDEIAHQIWSVTDDLHRTLLDREAQKEMM